jgi:hypothetical protein
VIKINRFNADTIPSTACTRRTHGRRRALEHNFAGGSSGTTVAEAGTTALPFSSGDSASIFLQIVCISDQTPALMEDLCAKKKLYLSCKSFSTMGSLAVAQIPFQTLCSEWSQIPSGWLQNKVERRDEY